MKNIFVKIDYGYDADIGEVAAEALIMAGRLNCPVVFTFRGINIRVGTSDTISDVMDRIIDAKKYGGSIGC